MPKNEFKKTMLRLWALLAGIMVLMMSHGFQNTLIAVRAEYEQFPSLLIALILSSHYIGNFLSSLSASRIIRKVGHVRAMGAFAAIASSATLLFAMYLNPYVWMVARIAAGWSITSMLYVCESWVQDFATNKNRGFIFSIYMTHIFFGLASGQFLLILIDFSSFTAFAAVSFLFSISAVPILLSAKTKPKPIERSKKRLGLLSLLSTSPVGFFGILLIGGLHAIMYNILPIYATRLNISNDTIATGMSALVIAGAISQVPFGRLSDRYDRRVVMLVIALAAALSLAPLAIIVPSDSIFIISCLFIGIFIFPLYAICVSHINDRVERGYRLSIIGVMISLNGFGSIVLLLLVEYLMSVYGNQAFFATAVAVCLLLSLLLLARLIIRKPVSGEQRRLWFAIPFVTRPTTQDNIANQSSGTNSSESRSSSEEQKDSAKT